MVYPGNFRRLVVAGSGDGDERWSWGLAIQLFDTSNDEPNPTEVPAGVVSAIRDFHRQTSSARAVVDSIKFNEIGPNGRYVNAATIEQRLEGATAIPGTQSGAQFPSQVSLAVTLRTDVKRGPANRGRFFIPYPAFALGDDGLLPEVRTLTVANAAGAMLDAINAAVPGQVVVASDVGAGAFRLVTAVECGSRYDIIRSRGKSLPERYARKLLAADPT